MINQEFSMFTIVSNRLSHYFVYALSAFVTSIYKALNGIIIQYIKELLVYYYPARGLLIFKKNKNDGVEPIV